MLTKLASFSDLTKIILLGSDPGISEEVKLYLFEIDITDQLQHLIIESGRRNGVLPLLYKNLKNHPLIPSNFRDQLKQYVLKGSMVQLNQEAVFREVHALFETHHIDFRVLKGFYLARYVYPEVFLRTMVDIDIMVPPEKVKSANALLLNHGFSSYAIAEHQFLSDQKHHPYGLKKNGVAVELHRSIFADYDPERIDEKLLWEDPVVFNSSGIIAKTLSPEVFLFHLCHHLMGHLRGDFIKLIWCRDIAMFVKVFRDKINWRVFLNLYHASGAREDLLHGLVFASNLMKTDVPKEVLTLVRTSSRDINDDFLWFTEHKRNDKPRPHLVRKIHYVQGTRNKITFLFLKLFPSPDYLMRYYGKLSKWDLVLLYPRYCAGFIARGVKAVIWRETH